jgi:hypothetical protein
MELVRSAPCFYSPLLSIRDEEVLDSAALATYSHSRLSPIAGKRHPIGEILSEQDLSARQTRPPKLPWRFFASAFLLMAASGGEQDSARNPPEQTLNWESIRTDLSSGLSAHAARRKTSETRQRKPCPLHCAAAPGSPHRTRPRSCRQTPSSRASSAAYARGHRNKHSRPPTSPGRANLARRNRPLPCARDKRYCRDHLWG